MVSLDADVSAIGDSNCCGLPFQFFLIQTFTHMTKPSSHLVSILNYSTFEDRSQKGIWIYGYCEQQRVMNSAAATFPEVRYHLILTSDWKNSACRPEKLH